MFTRPNLPLHIDIGCAKGRCIERMSKRPERKDWNHLGVEIRGRTVEEAMQRVANDRKLQQQQDENKNLYFLTCNFAASVKELLDKFPRESLRLISIQFPDPWKRKKHLRRLLVQKKLVRQLAASLPPGGVVYISSDCDNVAIWMVDRFLECEEEVVDEGNDSTSQGIEIREKHGTTDVIPKKKACFRLMPTHADLKSISTPNMFMTQSGLEEQDKLHVHVPSSAIETVKKHEDYIETEDGNESVNKSAESYLWFEANNNPLGELSERELVCEVDWRGVRRCCFIRL